MEETPSEAVASAARLQAVCLARGLTVATAESCTGGAVSAAITANPGSSAYFRGGIVAYSNEAKMALLDVPEGVLAAHGAVSAQTAVAMAGGAARRLRADVGVATTGVAGPDGGTEDKPVGLVYVAVHDAAGDDVRRFTWSGDRAENITDSVRAALELLLERVASREARG